MPPATPSPTQRHQPAADAPPTRADPDGAGAAQPTVPLTARYTYDAEATCARFAEGREEFRYAANGQAQAPSVHCFDIQRHRP
jgi:hypothetical protein